MLQRLGKHRTHGMKTLALPALAFACVLCAGLAPAPALAGSDLAKEKRWAEQVVDSLLDGEALMLHDGKTPFLGIFTQAEAPQPTGLIILHGIGVHPDYPEVINPLRVGLAERGWSTLSLQLPILPNEASGEDYAPLIPDALPRIRAGVEHLRGAGYEKIVIVAHSMGAFMSAYALAAPPAHLNGRVHGFVAIGMGPAGIDHLAQINTPMLDLYGGDDLPGVVDYAPERKDASAHNPDYTQLAAPGADHFFNGHEEAMVDHVAQWLRARF